jgi:hypothetical protein
VGFLRSIKKKLKGVIKLAVKTSPLWSSFIPGGSIVGQAIGKAQKFGLLGMGGRGAGAIGQFGASGGAGGPSIGGNFAKLPGFFRRRRNRRTPVEVYGPRAVSMRAHRMKRRKRLINPYRGVKMRARFYRGGGRGAA